MRVNGKTVWSRNPAHVYRDAEMILLFRDGHTLQEIGDKFGITRERVRQRLAKLGLSRECGGQAVRSLLNARKRVEALAERKEALEDKWLQRKGMTRAEWKAMGAKARNAYHQQRQSAARRGIEWKLTLGQWWAIWQGSGHWEERGRGPGYCMARWADDGPYSPENVYITTNSENIKHGYIVKPAAMRAAKAKITREAKNF